jgi:hypothetical protein
MHNPQSKILNPALTGGIFVGAGWVALSGRLILGLKNVFCRYSRGFFCYRHFYFIGALLRRTLQLFILF